jgi:flagellar basal-body rod protein FlgG
MRGGFQVINGFYTAKSGVKVFQTSLDITANNIANVNTEGYKAQSASFTDLMYTSAQGADFLVGNGARLASTTLRAEQGGLEQDGEGNVAIEGEGFFAIENAQGDTVYTRSGCFALSAEGNKISLVTTDGGYVLDSNGRHITVASDDLRAAVHQAGLYTFPNPDALAALGDSRYAETNASGKAVKDNASQIKESTLEMSNVDLASEMTRMMLAQRGVQFNLRMLQTADELEQVVNNLRT